MQYLFTMQAQYLDYQAQVFGVKHPSVAFDPAYNLMGSCKSSKIGQILGRIRFLIPKNERNYR